MRARDRTNASFCCRKRRRPLRISSRRLVLSRTKFAGRGLTSLSSPLAATISSTVSRTHRYGSYECHYDENRSVSYRKMTSKYPDSDHSSRATNVLSVFFYRSFIDIDLHDPHNIKILIVLDHLTIGQRHLPGF